MQVFSATFFTECLQLYLPSFGGHWFLVYLSCIALDLYSRSFRHSRWLGRYWVCSSIQVSQIHIALHRHDSEIHGRHFSRVSLQALHTLFLPSCHTEYSLKNSQSICSTQGSRSFPDSLYRATATGHPSCFKWFSWRFGVWNFWNMLIKDISVVFFLKYTKEANIFCSKNCEYFRYLFSYQQLLKQCHCIWP